MEEWGLYFLVALLECSTFDCIIEVHVRPVLGRQGSVAWNKVIK
jgi:hypothetical protein